MIQAGRQTYCGEVTHCMPSRVSSRSWMLWQDKPVSRVLDKFLVGVVVAVGHGQGGAVHVRA